ALGCRPATPHSPALGRRPALRRRSPPPGYRERDRLLGGGGAPFLTRGSYQVEKGGSDMSDGQASTTAIEDALRGRALVRDAGGPSPERTDPAVAGAASAAAARLNRRIAAEGLADVSYAPLDSPFGTLLLAATKRGLVRLAFPEEPVDSVLERLAHTLSPR